MISDLYRHRRAFWQFFAGHAPELHARTEYATEHSRWLAVGPMPLVIALYVANRGVGLFVRGARRTRIGHVREFLFPWRELLASELREPELRLGGSFLLDTRLRADMQERDNWPAAADWLARRTPSYERALAAVQRRRQPWPDMDEKIADDRPTRV